MSIPAKPEHERSTGARPAGVTSEQAAAANVQQMFDTIAPTYDRANHLLSAGLDRYWWTRAALRFRSILQRPESIVLDLCCGTGDMTLALYKHRPKPPGEIPSSPESPGAPSFAASPRRMGEEDPNPAKSEPAPILAIDFSYPMLSRGAEKFRRHNILPVQADALHLPLADNSIDLVTAAFGFRNLANYEEGLAEIHRVLRPGGQLGILEANQPAGPVGALYDLYFKTILPRVGGLISGSPRAYRYLPASVERFPRPPRMAELIRNAGFANATWSSYTFGTAGLYHATKP